MNRNLAFFALAVIASACAPRDHSCRRRKVQAHTATGSPPPTGAFARIAFGSCAFQWVEQPIFRAVVAAEPDLYLSLGDAIYGDFDGETTFDVTPESLREEWQELADNPGLAASEGQCAGDGGTGTTTTTARPKGAPSSR